jgi:hypothetical protein
MKLHLVAVLTPTALAGSAWGQIPTENLALWLRADQGVVVLARGIPPITQGNLVSWDDQSGNGHDATVDMGSTSDPVWFADGINGLPAVQFNGTQWMDIAGQVITGQQFTVFAVISDTGPGSGGREVFSDYASSNPNSNVFLGTGSNLAGTTRIANFTDGFSPTLTTANSTRGAVPSNTPILLAGESSSTDGAVYLDGSLLFDNNGPLNTMDIASPYTLASQGAGGAGLWQGDIAELIVYNAALSGADLNAVTDYLESKYDVPEPTAVGLVGVGLVVWRRPGRRRRAGGGS